MRLGLFFLCIGILPISWAVAAPQPVEKVSIDFLYVNANAGEAAGGHTALRFGNTIYHYQFFPDGTFLLVRDHWTSFYVLYNERHNRTIFIASIPVTKTVFADIKHHFTTLLVDQEQFFTALKKLQTQVEIRTSIAAGKGSVAIAGLGFFKPAGQGETITTAPLRQRILNQLGQDALTPKTEQNQLTLLESIAWQQALQILQKDTSLDPKTVIAPMPGEPVLDEQPLAVLKTFQRKQERAVLSLLQSTRPDRGKALLLQTARYLVVEKSITAKQFYTLDPFPDDAKTVTLTKGDDPQKLAVAQTDLFKQSRQRTNLFLQEKTHHEIAYSLLETSRARVAELHLAETRKNEVRLLAKVTLPSRSKRVALDLYNSNQAFKRNSLPELRQQLDAMQKEVSNRYHYNLFIRNCATELVQSLNSSFATKEEGDQKLGGWIEPNSGLAFIPFLLYDKSVATFPVQDEQQLTSRRLRHLKQLYAHENDLLVWLRESNTLSSTLYEPRSKDTYFLFFTDDTFLLRPFQGILNFGYAALHGVAGVFTLPFDGGERIHQAGRGLFYSLPELAFFNIRKGSYATGEPRLKPKLNQ